MGQGVHHHPHPGDAGQRAALKLVGSARAQSQGVVDEVDAAGGSPLFSDLLAIISEETESKIEGSGLSGILSFVNNVPELQIGIGFDVNPEFSLDLDLRRLSAGHTSETSDTISDA